MLSAFCSLPHPFIFTVIKRKYSDVYFSHNTETLPFESQMREQILGQQWDEAPY